jgi:hypothetical protein
MKLMERVAKSVENRTGRVLPYAILWWLGVPLFLLVIIRLVRGH